MAPDVKGVPPNRDRKQPNEPRAINVNHRSRHRRVIRSDGDTARVKDGEGDGAAKETRHQRVRVRYLWNTECRGVAFNAGVVVS